MGKVIYQTDYFKCALSTGKKFNAQLQEILDRYAAEGWRLHSYHIVGMGDFCSLVFYREEQD